MLTDLERFVKSCERLDSSVHAGMREGAVADA